MLMQLEVSNQDQLNAILTESCLGTYIELEDLICLGCHPFEMYYVSENAKGNKELRLCKDFAKRLWGAKSDDDLNLPTRKYDNCGFKSGYFYPEAESQFIMPSQNFTSIYHFFQQLLIPFYDTVDVVIVEDDVENCYNWKMMLKVNQVLVVIVAIGLMIV